jgi:hypothetical protein
MSKSANKQQQEVGASMGGIHSTPTSSKLAEMLLTLKSTEPVSLLTPNDARSGIMEAKIGRAKVRIFLNLNM